MRSFCLNEKNVTIKRRKNKENVLISELKKQKSLLLFLQYNYYYYLQRKTPGENIWIYLYVFLAHYYDDRV